MLSATTLPPAAALAAPEPPWPAPAVARAFMLAMLVTATLSFVHRYVPSVLVDDIRAEMRLTDVQFSLLQGTAFAALYVVASLACGLLADRTARRNLMVAGVALWTGGTLLFGISSAFESLFASRCMVGLGEATLGPASISMLCDYFRPSQRGRAIAVSFFGATLGSALAFSGGAWMLEAARAGVFGALPGVGGLAPWRQVVVLLGVSGFALVPLLLAFAEPPRRGAATNADALLQPAPSLWPLRGRLALVMLAGASVALADFGFSIWAPALLTRTYQFGTGTSGSLLGASMLVAGVCGGWLGGVWCDRAHARQGTAGRAAVVGGAAVAMALSAALLAVPAAWCAVAAFALWQVAANVAYVGCASALQDMVPPQRRGIAAALSLCLSIGFGLGMGPTSVAALNQQLGHGDDALLHSLLVVLWACAAVTGVCAARLRRRLTSLNE